MRIFFTALACACAAVVCLAGGKGKGWNARVLHADRISKPELEAVNLLQKLGFASGVDTPEGYEIELGKFSGQEGKIILSASCKKASIKYSDENDAPAAVGEFAREFLGLKVMAPPPLGLERDGRTKIPVGKISKKFSYLGRFFDFSPSRNKTYNLANGENDSYLVENHNIRKIVNPKVAQKHPEWLAMRGGARKGFSESKHPQIDFLNRDVSAFVAWHARVFFRKNPSKKIFSASYSDAPTFDDTQKTLMLRRRPTPHGYEDYGNAVFSFTNSVAARASTDFPGKFVGELAYLYTETPPDFKMHPNTAIYLCVDRSKNFDETQKKIDSELIRSWAASGVGRLGIYSYNYGLHYFVPRGSARIEAESIKFACECGATLYTCESTPVWAYDAHKMWVITSMLKNADADAGKIESEFFNSYYKEAAPYIRDFFSVAEAAWTKRNVKSSWLKLFKRESQAEVLDSGSISKMEAALSAAERLPYLRRTARDRIMEIRLVFDITKAFIDTYNLQKKLFFRPDATRANSAEILSTVEAVKIAQLRKRLALRRYHENTKYPKSDFSIWEKMSFIDATENAAEDLLALEIPEISNRVSELFGAEFAETARGARNATEKTLNSGFENGIEKWSPYKTGGCPEKLDITDKLSCSGKYSAEMSSKNFVGLTQAATISEGKTCVAEAKVYGELKAGDVCYLRLSFYDKRGKTIMSKRQQLPAGFFDFGKLRVVAKSPKGARLASLSVFVGNLDSSSSLYIDDAKISEGR